MPTALSTPDKYQQSPSPGQHHSRLGDRARLPAFYVVTAADLHPVHDRNRIFKFTDDKYLFVSGVNTDTCQEEIGHRQTWAADNNLKLNRNKTKEIVFSSVYAYADSVARLWFFLCFYLVPYIVFCVLCFLLGGC